MGRGESQGGVSVGRREESTFGVDKIVSGLGRHNRDLSKRGFVKDKEAWKSEENAYIARVMKDLEAAAAQFAASDENWKDYLKIYSLNTYYSTSNILFAAAQLRARGVEEEGLVLSESLWRTLGRRPKAEFARPEKKRDERYGFNRNREWDSTYCVDMTRPIGLITREEVLKDKNGNPVLDANGNEMKRKRSFWKGGEERYGGMIAYHEAATEDIKGGPAKPLPEAPWQNATGSVEDAQRLLDDITRHVLPKEKMSIEFKERSTDRESAAWVVGSKIIVDSNRSIQDQAVGVLGAVAHHGEAIQGKDEEVSDAKNRAEAAGESVKYLVAQLYGLDSKEQTFPFVAEIAKAGKVKKLNSEIHRRTNRLLSRLDPTLRLLMSEKEKARPKKPSSKKRSSRAQAGVGAF